MNDAVDDLFTLPVVCTRIKNVTGRSVRRCVVLGMQLHCAGLGNAEAARAGTAGWSGAPGRALTLRSLHRGERCVSDYCLFADALGSLFSRRREMP